MYLMLDARECTRSVDAWFSEPQIVREAARMRRLAGVTFYFP